MITRSPFRRLLMFTLVFLHNAGTAGQEKEPQQGHKPYIQMVKQCMDTLIQSGTDRYGGNHIPVLVSILDIKTRNCPRSPKQLDEAWRVTRRGRRNPAGSNMLTDQPLLKAMHLLSKIIENPKYAQFAGNYTGYVMRNLTDSKGFFWWGWHRHYDVYTDTKTGHAGNHHEIHAINSIDWARLWEVNPKAVQREIEAIWKWHVVDKQTGEINR